MSTTGGRGACGGDNGGPLTVQSEGSPLLVGVISFIANAGCELGYPVGFTRVTNYISWIQSNMNP